MNVKFSLNVSSAVLGLFNSRRRRSYCRLSSSPPPLSTNVAGGLPPSCFRTGGSCHGDPVPDPSSHHRCAGPPPPLPTTTTTTAATRCDTKARSIERNTAADACDERSMSVYGVS